MTAKEQLEAAAAKLSLTMTAEFIPWSRSRNAGEKSPSLNWKVTILRNSKPILTTDYSAGCGHCPSYRQGDKSVSGRDAVRLECEHGRPAVIVPGGHAVIHANAKPLAPEFANVLHSLVSDAEVIQYPTFEDWAEEFGYDSDSRKAEATYRACLEIALKLRAVIGEDGLQALADAGQDY